MKFNLHAGVASLAILPFLFAVPATAQGATTSPSGWDNTEGPGISQLLGGYQESRFQFLDGEVNKLGAKISQVDMRLDKNFGYDQPARTWQGILLYLAHTNVQKHSTTLSQNPTTTPQLVFISKVSWPKVKNSSVGKPAPWGGVNGEYRFPFRTPFTKVASKDLLLDFAFRQGALANNAAWNTLNLYPLDGFDEREEITAPSQSFGSMNCRASGQSRTAACEVSMFTYRKQAYTTQRADKVVAWLSTWFAAPSTPVVQALGTIQSPGTAIGTCQQLYVKPQMFVFANTDSTGTASTYLGSVPYQPALAGVPIGAQAIYRDSKTQRFELTLATNARVAQQQGPYLVNRVSYYATSANATQGWFADHWSNPLFRYTYK
jgi:hypothetical protein